MNLPNVTTFNNDWNKYQPIFDQGVAFALKAMASPILTTSNIRLFWIFYLCHSSGREAIWSKANNLKLHSQRFSDMTVLIADRFLLTTSGTLGVARTQRLIGRETMEIFLLSETMRKKYNQIIRGRGSFQFDKLFRQLRKISYPSVGTSTKKNCQKEFIFYLFILQQRWVEPRLPGYWIGRKKATSFRTEPTTSRQWHSAPSSFQVW